MPVSLPLMKNVLTTSAESVLVPLGLTAVALATDAAVQKKIFGLGMTAPIIPNKEMDDLMKIVKYPEETGYL